MTTSDSNTTTPINAAQSSDTLTIVYEEAKQRIKNSRKLREETNILEDLNINILTDEDVYALQYPSRIQEFSKEKGWVDVIIVVP